MSIQSEEQDEISGMELGFVSLLAVTLASVAVWPFVGSSVALAFLGLSGIIVGVVVVLRG